MGKVVIAAVVAQAVSLEIAEVAARVAMTRKVIACAFCLTKLKYKPDKSQHSSGEHWKKTVRK